VENLEPYLTQKDKLNNEVINRLQFLGAEGTIAIGPEPSTMQVFRCPASSKKNKPNEETSSVGAQIFHSTLAPEIDAWPSIRAA
jgi:hypothetical protein